MELKKVFLVSASLAGLIVSGLNYLRVKADKGNEENLAKWSLIAGGDEDKFEELSSPKPKEEPIEIDPHEECEKLYEQAFSIINNAKKRYACHLVEEYPNSKTSWLVRARRMKPFLESAERHFRNHYEAYTGSKVVNLSEADLDKLVEMILDKYRDLKYPEKKTQALER